MFKGSIVAIVTPFKNGKIFAFDSDGLFSRPTLRILEGAKKLRESILKK